MSAYLIAEVEVTDPAAYERYRALTPGAIAAHGGRFIVRGGKTELLEGTERPKRIVVIEFKDMAAAQRFYASEDYAAALAIRKRAAKSRVFLVEGAPPA